MLHTLVASNRLWSPLSRHFSSSQNTGLAEWASAKLKLTKLEDWYSVTPAALSQVCGENVARSLLPLSTALVRAYPDHSWDIWRLGKVPRGYWEDLSNRKKFFDRLLIESGSNNLEDWYSVSTVQITQFGGRGLLKHYYHDSIAEAVMSIYKEHVWQPWRFHQAPRSCWSSMDTQREFMDMVAAVLHLRTQESWSDVTTKDVMRLGGAGLLDRYGGSLSDLLAALKYARQTPKQETKLSDDRKLLHEIEHKLRISSLEGWYAVSAPAFRRAGGAALMKRYGGLSNLLSELYPSHVWDSWRFTVEPDSEAA